MRCKFLSVCIFCYFFAGWSISSKKTAQIVVQENKNEEIPVTKSDSEKIPRYEILKETNLRRTDKGITYFVLIYPVDLRTDAFVGQVKNLV